MRKFLRLIRWRLLIGFVLASTYGSMAVQVEGFGESILGWVGFIIIFVAYWMLMLPLQQKADLYDDITKALLETGLSFTKEEE